MFPQNCNAIPVVRIHIIHSAELMLGKQLSSKNHLFQIINTFVFSQIHKCTKTQFHEFRLSQIHKLKNTQIHNFAI